MSSRKSLDGMAILLMIVLCLCWVLQQVAVKLAAPAVGHTMRMGLRSAIAALMVVLLIQWRKIPFSLRDGSLWPGLLAGSLFAAEFLCVALGLHYTSASHMSVFLYTAPIFTVLGLHWLVPGEHLGGGQWLGILAAFAGVALAFSDGLAGSVQGTDMLYGDTLAVIAALLWAATTIAIRKSHLSEAEPTTTLLYQLGGGALLLTPYAVLQGESLPPLAAATSFIAWTSLLFQGVVVAFASYLAWFWLMRRYLTSRLSAFSFLTPLFGVAAGVIILHDALSPRFALGAALVLAGIVLANRRKS
jgi:drug/metabolite transporter (DMT)-like permease